MTVRVAAAAAADFPQSRYAWVERALEWPVAILALAVVPALIIEDRTTSESVRRTAITINWVAWLAFVTEFLVRLALATHRWRYVRYAWFDLALIVITPPFLVPDFLQGARSIRAVRAVRLLRVLRAGPSRVLPFEPYVACSTIEV